MEYGRKIWSFLYLYHLYSFWSGTKQKVHVHIYEADQMLTTGSLFSLDVIMYNRVQLHGVECLHRLTISVKIDSTEKLYFEFSLTSCGRVAMMMVMMMMLIKKWNKYTHMYYYCCSETKNFLYQKNCFIRTSYVDWMTQKTGPINDLVRMHHVSKCLSLKWMSFLRKEMFSYIHFK